MRALAVIGQLLALVVLVVSAVSAAAMCSGDNVACDPSDRTRAALTLVALGLWVAAAIAIATLRRRLERRRDDDAASWMLFAVLVVLAVQLLAAFVPIWVAMG